MWIGVFGAVTFTAGLLGILLLPHPAGASTAMALLGAFVALLARGIASVRSGLLEPTVWRSGDPQDARVGLTFDDGPHPTRTDQVLAVLREHDVTATFFVVGENVRRHAGVVKRIVAGGHEIGCHADSHAPRTAFFRRARMAAEIRACTDAVRAETGLTPRLYRPPYGIRSPAHCGLARALDLVTVGMARRGHDKDPGATADAVARRTVACARPGEILALHDGDEPGRPSATPILPDALPAILSGLAARGLHAVHVSTLLAERPYRESPTRRWSGRTHGGHVGNAIFVWVVRTFGTRPAEALLVFVAAWFTVWKGAARRASLDLLRRVRGPRPLPARIWWVYRHFFVYGRTLLWRLRFLIRGDAPPEVEHRDFERVREVVETPGPLLLVSGHQGDWSSACRRLQADVQRPLWVVAYRGVGLGPHQVRETAEGATYRLIDVEAPAQDVAVQIVSALSQGDVVAVHADRLMRDEAGVVVPFLGGEAAFPTGVWTVAMLTGAPAVVYFSIPLSARLSRIYCYGPIRVPRVPVAERGEVLRRAAAEFAGYLEDCVRRHPLHWGNFYDVWNRA